MKLLHNYVMIQLIPFEGETITAGGLIIPKTTIEETSGGSFKSIVDEKALFQPRGTVLAVADKATVEYPALVKGATVRVGKGALSPNHQYSLDVTTPHQEWEGLILIPSGLIEMVEN
jgi:co-chaperonin GroES (HSP10)